MASRCPRCGGRFGGHAVPSGRCPGRPIGLRRKPLKPPTGEEIERLRSRIRFVKAQGIAPCKVERAEKPLFVPVAEEPYLKYLSGVKTVEVRERKGGWHEGNVWEGRPLRIRHGYGPKAPEKNLVGVVGRVAVATGFENLPEWARMGAAVPRGRSRFFNRGETLIAFETLHLEHPSES